MPTNAQRLCGAGLTVNSLYNQLRLADPGEPGIEISKLVICFPAPIDPIAMGLPVLGVKIFPRVNDLGQEVTDNQGNIIYDIWDIVGSVHYPYPADFYEEVKRKGFSRKLPKNAPVGLLSIHSVHFLMHEKAIINSPDMHKFWTRAADNKVWCLAHHSEHDNVSEKWIDQHLNGTCSAFWYDIPKELDYQGMPVRNGLNYVYRVYPSGVDRTYSHGAFMWFPIGELVVTKGLDKKVSPEAQSVIDALKKAGLGGHTQVVDINDVPETWI